MKKLILLVFCLLFIFLQNRCAKRGVPSGGEKDTIPPVMIKASPKQKSIFFDKELITLNFNEYIKLNEIDKQLIISPPLEKSFYDIKPKISASKKIEIKLLKPLEENTTYTFNFGKSIQDNNEANELSYFSYALSTGESIDSLELNGKISDAINKEVSPVISLQLYPIDSTYNDSTIFLKKPLYVSISDSLNFKFENLRAGIYELIAIEDFGGNYFFDQNIDKIGFLDKTIEIPKDTFAELVLFKEITNFGWGIPKYINDHHVEFPYYGDYINDEITLKNIVDEDFRFLINKHRTKDTLNFWYSNPTKFDSLIFNLKIKDTSKTVIVKPKKIIKDSLVIKNIQKNFLNLSDSIIIESNLPLLNFNSENIKILDVDSLQVDFKLSMDENFDRFYININPLPNDNYYVILNPDSVEDLWYNTNKKLEFSLKTKSVEDYGIIIIQLQGDIPVSYFIELLDFKGKVIRKKLGNSLNDSYTFSNLEPGKYNLRLIKDSNMNNKWDTGNYLKKINPEKVIYLPKVIDLRANWEINEIFLVN